MGLVPIIEEKERGVYNMHTYVDLQRFSVQHSVITMLRHYLELLHLHCYHKLVATNRLI